MKSYRLEVFPKTQEVPLLRFHGQIGTEIQERPLPRDEVERFAQDVEAAYRKTIPSLPRLGRLLYEWVDGPTQRWLERVVRDPEGLALHIDVAERLRHLPWELIMSGYSYLCANPLCPFTPIRRVANHQGTYEIANRPLRILFMATSPEEVQPVLNFEAEEGMILQATRNQGVELIVEESGTLEQLQHLVEYFGPGYFDVVHLSGHANVIDGTPVFVMENDLGLRRDVRAEEIA